MIETSFNKFPVEGLSMDVNMSQSYGKNASNKFPLTLSYENDMLAAQVNTTAPDFKSVTASCVLATDGLMVGSSLTYSNGGIGDYPISLSYKGPGYTAAVEACDELKTFNILGSYKVNNELSLATKVMIPDGSKEAMSFAGVYSTKDEFNTKFAAKFSHATGFGPKGDKAKTIECAVTAKPLPKVETGAALALPISNMGAYKYGLTFTLG